eukprot:g11914.t1
MNHLFPLPLGEYILFENDLPKPDVVTVIILDKATSCEILQVARHIHREAISKLGIFVGPQQKGLESGPLPEWFISWALRILEPQAVCPGEIVINAEESSLVQELFLVFEGECEAFYHRNMWRQRQTGGHSDTGGWAVLVARGCRDPVEVSSDC